MIVHDFLEWLVHGLRYHQVLKHFRPCDRLADLGSGDEPRFLRKVHDRTRQCWGLDPQTRPGQEGNITLLKADITRRLPFEDAFLDQVSMLAVVEHVDEPRVHEILAECRRVLRPGGRLIATTPSALGILVHELMRRVGLIRDVKEDEHRDFGMSPERLRAWLARAGFEVEAAYLFELGLNVIAVGTRPISP